MKIVAEIIIIISSIHSLRFVMGRLLHILSHLLLIAL